MDVNDLHAYDPAGRAWVDLSRPAAGSPPSARECLGFASAGGRLYVYGGTGEGGGAAVCEHRIRETPGGGGGL